MVGVVTSPFRYENTIHQVLNLSHNYAIGIRSPNIHLDSVSYSHYLYDLEAYTVLGI